ncbi:MmcQ/YjbR family DNA-binding protein [Aeromicrobium sp.]|uniref:MmcQ/YjbR family DNA-binding protein n=1 Tax=Aeromicrobium sp. TaxID=1871063 RepID=UPI0025BEDAC5|nr:MmcQ/YjbR family DNA-binding protein [Aeromicrobium sp.]MCK5891306.1 MmcQ/YjbR family DNA-binding protein [Aeromicrobium sp.]
MDWDAIVAHLTQLPDTELTTTWGNPAVKTGGKLVAWWRDAPDSPGSVAVKVAPEELEALVADDTSPFFTIEHFRKFGTNAVLVRPEEVAPEELRELLTEAWRLMAKVRVRKAWEAES